MTQISKDSVLSALRNVKIPGTNDNVVDNGLISSIVTKDNNVGFVIEANNQNNPQNEEIRVSCEQEVLKIKDVEKVTAVLTAEVNQEQTSNKPKPPSPKKIPGVKNIIAVASGKGGVGKSTVSVNLAASLQKLGYSVGLVDADIYGPSIAHMMNLKGKPDVKENMMIPIESNGVKCMSMGTIIDEDVPVVWRGPMISKALKQLTFGTNWEGTDFLIIDLPPGTGDIHISLAQNFEFSGAVIVASPQEVALLDVKKAISMFKKVGVPILGIVENMSYMVSESGEKINIFGEGGVDKICKKLDLKPLGKIALTPDISKLSDQGTPYVSQKNDNIADIFTEIAKEVSKT